MTHRPTRRTSPDETQAGKQKDPLAERLRQLRGTKAPAEVRQRTWHSLQRRLAERRAESDA
ncbi:MAG TPA: DUF2890 domain-containing protein [Solirubrobacterales bacterium]|nr:DUF2890 domain-containing protein [Solirubrobacterales bacterium]